MRNTECFVSQASFQDTSITILTSQASPQDTSMMIMTCTAILLSFPLSLCINLVSTPYFWWALGKIFSMTNCRRHHILANDPKSRLRQDFHFRCWNSSSVFIGVGATLSRDVPFSALYWGMLEPIRQSLTPDGPDGSSQSRVFGANLVAGSVGGAIASALTQPLVSTLYSIPHKTFRLFFCPNSFIYSIHFFACKQFRCTAPFSVPRYYQGI